MNGTIRAIALATALFGMFIVTEQASGQDLSAVYQFQRLIPDGESGDNLPTGFGIDVSAPLSRTISAVGQFDWSRKSESETIEGFSLKVSMQLATYAGGVRWTAAGHSVRPFVQFLVGATRATLACSVGGVDCAEFGDSLDAETHGMGQVGGGVLVPIGGKADIVAQADYRRYFGDFQSGSLRLATGVRIRFK